jgi:hypothetical protein
MVYNLAMSGYKLRLAALTAVLGIVLGLAVLALRGLKAATAAEPPPVLVWREAGEGDLF